MSEEKFVTKATAANAVVSSISSFAEAVAYATSLSKKMGAEGATISAPGLAEDEIQILSEQCVAGGVELVTKSLRNYPQGVDVGLTYGNFGVADTGSIVLNCPSEELRLSSMVSDAHVCILDVKNIVEKASEIEGDIEKFVQNAGYVSFITGPSRTADVERVLTIGAHGPLELHVLILGGK